jgi:hypothetical protein
MTIGRVDSTPNTVSLLDLDQQLDCSLAGDSGASIAALLVLSARDSRNQASAARQADEQRSSALEGQQVQDLYDQADATRTAGWLQGTGEIISGGFAIAGSVAGANANTPQQQAGAKAYAGAGDIGKGTLDMVASEYTYEANVSSADATAAGNEAKSVERHLHQLSEEQSDASQLMRTALQTASDLVRSKTAGDQATIFLRG